jgi:hypothetical protein
MAYCNRHWLWFCCRALFLHVCVLSACLLCSAGSIVEAATVVINEDTTIDAASTMSGSHVQVVDGPDGQTNVSIVNGGSVAGFDGREHSEIILDGGIVTYLSSLEGSATFVMKSGQIGCSEQVCQLIRYDALLRADDFSTLHFFGGNIGGILRLNDSSVAHFYGRNLLLTVFNQSFASVEGVYGNGDPLQATFRFRPDIDTHVILHNVPEPVAAPALVGLAHFFLYGFRIIRRRTQS